MRRASDPWDGRPTRVLAPTATCLGLLSDPARVERIPWTSARLLPEDSTMPHRTRIGIYIDGGHFALASNFYVKQHPRQAGLDAGGLKRLARRLVAEWEGVSQSACAIVEAAYYREKLDPLDSLHEWLLDEADVDQSLFIDGFAVRTHLRQEYTREAPQHGIGLRLSLDARERSVRGTLDAVVLIAGTFDYLPLVRKLREVGVRVYVLGWDILFRNDHSSLTRLTGVDLLIKHASRGLGLAAFIDDPAQAGRVDELFRDSDSHLAPPVPTSGPVAIASRESGSIEFVTQKVPRNAAIAMDGGEEFVWFSERALEGAFESLRVGCRVTYHPAWTAAGSPRALAVQLAPSGVEPDLGRASAPMSDLGGQRRT